MVQPIENTLAHPAQCQHDATLHEEMFKLKEELEKVRAILQDCINREVFKPYENKAPPEGMFN